MFDYVAVELTGLQRKGPDTPTTTAWIRRAGGRCHQGIRHWRRLLRPPISAADRPHAAPEETAPAQSTITPAESPARSAHSAGPLSHTPITGETCSSTSPTSIPPTTSSHSNAYEIPPSLSPGAIPPHPETPARPRWESARVRRFHSPVRPPRRGSPWSSRVAAPARPRRRDDRNVVCGHRPGWRVR